MLADLASQLPADLIVARTSDQPLQVAENVDLFMTSLYEAVVLVVVVGADRVLGVALGAADGAVDPDHAGDDVRVHVGARPRPAAGVDRLAHHRARAARGRSGGGRRRHQARAGGRPVAPGRGLARPDQAGRAILFATITNIVAYLPLLLLSGDLGRFIYSLPVVLACSLVASRIVSMTFVPLLGYYLLRGEPQAERSRGRAAPGLRGDATPERCAGRCATAGSSLGGHRRS